MKRALTSLLVLSLAAPLLGGCIIDNRPRHRHGHAYQKSSRPACGPAYHWNGSRCVHNGNGKAKGHYK